MPETKQDGPLEGNHEFHEEMGDAHDALNRMRRASERGTGCHLTAEMIQTLSLTVIGQMWMEADPRSE